MKISVLYIDDEVDRPSRDAQKIKELLEVPRRFDIELRRPPADFADLQIPDALLIDYELNTKPEQGQPVSYFGTSLAAEVRMRIPACPIILVTRPAIISGRVHLIEESINADLIVYKEDVLRDPDRERARVIELIEGFQALGSIEGQEWEKVLNLMGTEGDEINLLRETAPPVFGKQWNIPQSAKWIREVVMGFPGILYDDLTAATRLGITLESFQKPRVQKLFKPAKYSGVFGSFQKRWWRNRLFGIAQRLILRHELQGPVSQDFANAFHVGFRQKLKQAECVYDGTPIADWVCYILKKPVKLQNSIPYYPDKRPPVMDQARVSFKAVRESDEFDESLVDADSYEIIKKLWERP